MEHITELAISTLVMIWSTWGIVAWHLTFEHHAFAYDVNNCGFVPLALPVV